jgi:hypothetical protein
MGRVGRTSPPSFLKEVSMSYGTKLFYPEGVVDLIVAADIVSPGDVLGYSSGWVLADADAKIGGTITDDGGTATGSPVTLTVGDNVIAVSAVGTFTVLLYTGTIGSVVGDGTCNVTGERLALAAGSTTITTTGAAGNITITIVGTANVYGQYIALQMGKAGDQIKACKKCLRFDEDAPWAANTAYYLSGTAGDITATRPATDGDLVQVVGRSLDTSRLLMNIKEPQEFELFLSPDVYDTTGEPGLGTTDAGWVGPQIDAATELAFFKGRFPSGLISLDVARVIYNSIGASAYDTDVTVVRGYDGASNVEDTGTAITAGDWNADTDNALLYQNILAAFDADFVKPNACFAVKLDPDGITGDAQVIGLYLRGFKV